MAPPKKEPSVELCKRVTSQGNTIAIRMLEYLSSAKHAILGFQTLATDFIELCQVLWTIEAGLTEAARSHNTLPVEVAQELDKRIRQVHDEFVVLGQMVSKFVDNENHKGGFGRRFRMMFADTDIDKMRTTLCRSRDTLKVSSAMFRWSLGDARADASMGIGYAGLIAALERLNPAKAASLPSLHPPPSIDLPPTPPAPPMKGSNHPDSLRAPHRLERTSMNEIHHSNEEVHSYHSPVLNDTHLRQPQDDMNFSRGTTDSYKPWRAPSVHSSGSGTHSTRDTMYNNQHGRLHADTVYDAPASVESPRSRMYLEDKIHDLNVHERHLNDSQSRMDSPITSLHWAPRQTNGSKPAGGKAALITAVEQKKHRVLEQLLEGGARADAPMEAAMLQIAAQNRDTESITLLLRYGADPNGSDREGVTPLFAATRAQCFESAKALLKHGADCNISAGPDSVTPLAVAASHNLMDLTQLYLANNGKVDTIMENGSTALTYSMNKIVSPKVIEVLLSSGGDANAKDSTGTTALFQAIQINRVDLMTTLLDNGANPNLPGPKHPLWPSTYKPKALQLLLARGADHKKTPGVMELAASLKNLESVKILVDAGVSPNTRKDGVYTPLCSAIRDNTPEIVTYLLEHGADPNFKSAEYPAFKCITHKRLHFLPQLVAAGADLHKPKGIMETAVAHNDKDAIMYLLDQGVSPNDRVQEGGMTALTTAIRDNRGEFVDLLLSHGADPTIRGENWPLCMAVKQPAILKKLLVATPNPRAFRGVIEMAVVANQLESVKLLLAAGVSVEDKNCGVFSPLTSAIREDRKDIVRYLLDVANADPNGPGEHLPMVKALRKYNGDTEIIQMLLTRGADINKMHRGWNPVLQAVENGDAQVLKLLIEMGGPVDLQVQNEEGRAVLDIVTERGWEEGLALLFPNAAPTQKVKQ
ncbi:ankyrin repeat-containing domain protein [Phaeosphaeriaceae sp. PMI808]|nr:ankyrin repeat-containing domain protein [Phaeosphaeriaceae sp. PMI808]